MAESQPVLAGLQSECEWLCRCLGERSLPVLLLKVAALALTCNECSIPRPMSDLDGMLRKMEAAEARLVREATARCGVGPCTALALLEAARLFDPPLPAELAAWAPQAAGRPGLRTWVSEQAPPKGEAL